MGNRVPHSPRAALWVIHPHKIVYHPVMSTQTLSKSLSHTIASCWGCWSRGVELRERELRLAFGEIESPRNSYREQDANETSICRKRKS